MNKKITLLLITFWTVFSIRFTYSQEGNLLEYFDHYTAPVRLIAGVGESGLTISIDSLRATRTTNAGVSEGSIVFDAFAEFQLPLSMFGDIPVTKIRFEGDSLPLAGTNVVSKLKVQVTPGKSECRIPMYDDKVDMVIDKNSYVAISCNGFEEMGLSGYFEFKEHFIYAVNGGSVKADFNLVFRDVEDMLFAVNFQSPFKLNGTGNFIFDVKDAVVDMSTVRNADGFRFPSGYSSSFPVEDESCWTGFSLKSLEVEFPSDLSFGHIEKLSVQNMLIDEYGLSGWFAVGLTGVGTENNMYIDFSLDSIAVGIVRNRLSEGFLAGSLDIKPLKDENTKESLNLSLNGRFYYEDNKIQYDFGATLEADKTYNLPFVKDYGKITLARGCSIGFENDGSGTEVVVTLNGKLSFQSKEINIADLRFQDLIISTRSPYFGGGVFALNSSMGFDLCGLKIAITKFEAGYNANAKVAWFGAGAKLEIISDGPGASVEAGFVLQSDVQNNWAIIGLHIDTIQVKIDFSAFGMEGWIVHHKEDPIYGNGFEGELKMRIKPLRMSDLTAACRFGRTLDSYDKGGRQGSFRYWYAKLESPLSVPLFPPTVPRRWRSFVNCAFL